MKSPPQDVARAFGVDIRDNFPARYNIAPTQPIAIIRQSDRRTREYALARWGFIPSWACKEHLERMGSKPLINARGETALVKPTFNSALKRRRCLIPADGFYEWKSEADGKQPYCIRPADDTLFAFAGIWETATDPEGGEIDTAAILTVAAGADLRSLHRREPVVIAPEEFATWLEADERDDAVYGAMIASAPTGFWQSFAVSKRINSPRNDGPAVAEPIAA